MRNSSHSRTLVAWLFAAGLFLASGGNAMATVHYVDVNSASNTPPYTSWATAATNIQDAVDAAAAGDEIVVANGHYATGSRMVDGVTTNRVALDKALTLRSVNGPLSTTIDGGGTVRCAYLTNGASLSGFTLTNGVAGAGGGVFCESQSAAISDCVVSGNATYAFGPYDADGGGAFGGTLNNCMLTGNWAGGGGGASGCILNNSTLSGNSAGDVGGAVKNSTLNGCMLTGNHAVYVGGGAYGCVLNNCTLGDNSARQYSSHGPGTLGGGAAYCTLNNCTLIGNRVFNGLDETTQPGLGGGAYYSTLNNCIAYFNTADNYHFCTLNYCCTTPQPTNGFGNITNEPAFVDQASGNLRLESNSPCINAGRNAFAPAGVDLDGNERIRGGNVDMGAYEFQLPTSMISYAWLQQHALPSDGSADFADPDGDGLNNWQEWRCGTDPTNALSALRLLAPAVVGSDLLLRWESVSDRTYFLERSTSVSSTFTPLAIGIPGQPGTTSFTHTDAVGTGPWFYRVGVQ